MVNAMPVRPAHGLDGPRTPCRCLHRGTGKSVGVFTRGCPIERSQVALIAAAERDPDGFDNNGCPVSSREREKVVREYRGGNRQGHWCAGSSIELAEGDDRKWTGSGVIQKKIDARSCGGFGERRRGTPSQDDQELCIGPQTWNGKANAGQKRDAGLIAGTDTGSETRDEVGAISRGFVASANDAFGVLAKGTEKAVRMRTTRNRDPLGLSNGAFGQHERQN